MNHLRELLRSLGNAGALQNASALAESRMREDWLISVLDRHVSRSDAARTPLRRTA